MKISEFTTKSFLGGAGAAANSYILVNYEDNSTSSPVTYKASIQEIGNAIAKELSLPSVDVSQEAITHFRVKGVSSGAYTNTEKTLPVQTVGMGDIDTPSSSIKMVGYNTSSGTLGYYPGSGNSLTAISAGGGAIDPSQAVMIPTEVGAETSIEALPVFVDSSGVFYDGSNSGAAVELFGTYNRPVVVYDSQWGIGYFETADSTLTTITVNANPPVSIEDSGTGHPYNYLVADGSDSMGYMSSGAYIEFGMPVIYDSTSRTLVDMGGQAIDFIAPGALETTDENSIPRQYCFWNKTSNQLMLIEDSGYGKESTILGSIPFYYIDGSNNVCFLNAHGSIMAKIPPIQAGD